MKILNLKSFQKKIEPKLRQFFNAKIKQSQKIHPEITHLIKEIKNYVLNGGKKIRPYLIYLGYLAYNGKNPKQIIEISMGFELIHNYLLIHDDIIDQDKIRRNKPTIHINFAKYYKKNYLKKDPKYLGISNAIICGDLLSNYAYEIFTQSKLKNYKALNQLNTIIEQVLYGEILDVNFATKKEITQKEVLKVYEYKTARYTIEGPLRLGAILARAKKEDLKNLSKFALPVGNAFQLTDDLLGLFGDSKKSGKSNISDLQEGIKTLPIILALTKADPKEKNTIFKALGNQNLTQKQANQVRLIVKRTGAYDKCLKKSQQLVKKGNLALNRSNINIQVKSILYELAEYIINRKS